MWRSARSSSSCPVRSFGFVQMYTRSFVNTDSPELLLRRRTLSLETVLHTSEQDLAAELDASQRLQQIATQLNCPGHRDPARRDSRCSSGDCPCGLCGYPDVLSRWWRASV